MKDKIKGLIYGAILSDSIASKFKGLDHSAGYKINYRDIMSDQTSMSDQTNKFDWTSVSDRFIILMNTITGSKEYINVFALADKLLEWQDKGIIELPEKSDKHIGMNLNFVLKQKDYLTNPIKSSKHSYKLMGGDSAPNDALVCNSICGMSPNWYKNTILHTIITTYDSRCLAACLTQSFIINCIFHNKMVNWHYINPICQRAIILQGTRKTPNLIEYNNHFHLALNYKNFLNNYKPPSEGQDDSSDNLPPTDSAYLAFLKKLNIGNYNENDNQSYSLIGMVLSMIITIDIQFEISAGRYPNTEYFTQRVCETASCGGDSTANCSIIGAIIGLFIGFNNLPSEWLKKINNAAWLELKVNAFIVQKQENH